MFRFKQCNFFLTEKKAVAVAVEQVEVGVAEINSQLCTAMFTIVLSEAGYTSVLHRDKERSLLFFSVANSQ
jgi:hypothetical protein